MLPVDIARRRARLGPDVPIPRRVQIGSRPAAGRTRGGGKQKRLVLWTAGLRACLPSGRASTANIWMGPECVSPRSPPGPGDEGPRCAHGEPVFHSILLRERLWEGGEPGASEPGAF